MSASLQTLLDEIQLEDIVSIMPQGLKTGTTLWIRLGCPKGKDEFMRRMLTRPGKQTHQRSGWMCGAALLVSANSKLGDKGRSNTKGMDSLLDLFKGYLVEFSYCITTTDSHLELEYRKDENICVKIKVPQKCVNAELERWLSTPWPKTSSNP